MSSIQNLKLIRTHITDNTCILIVSLPLLSDQLGCTERLHWCMVNVFKQSFFSNELVKKCCKSITEMRASVGYDLMRNILISQ